MIVNFFLVFPIPYEVTAIFRQVATGARQFFLNDAHKNSTRTRIGSIPMGGTFIV
jgi:hypothetical protein